MNRRPRKNNNHPKNYNNYNDPFGMGMGMGMDSDDFGFGIHEEFDDPFEGIMGDFGFPSIAQIHQRLFGNM